jgi:hypothetical protein
VAGGAGEGRGGTGRFVAGRRCHSGAHTLLEDDGGAGAPVSSPTPTANTSAAEGQETVALEQAPFPASAKGKGKAAPTETQTRPALRPRPVAPDAELSVPGEPVPSRGKGKTVARSVTASTRPSSVVEVLEESDDEGDAQATRKTKVEKDDNVVHSLDEVVGYSDKKATRIGSSIIVDVSRLLHIFASWLTICLQGKMLKRVLQDRCISCIKADLPCSGLPDARCGYCLRQKKRCEVLSVEGKSFVRGGSLDTDAFAERSAACDVQGDENAQGEEGRAGEGDCTKGSW